VSGEGVVGTVFVEVNIVQLQQRTYDTGFEDFLIIPVGGEKVFIYCLEINGVMFLFNQALDFF